MVVVISLEVTTTKPSPLISSTKLKEMGWGSGCVGGVMSVLLWPGGYVNTMKLGNVMGGLAVGGGTVVGGNVQYLSPMIFGGT